MTPEDPLLNASLNAARDYADAVLVGPLRQLGAILSETLGGWRLRNQVRILTDARKMLEENQIDPQKVLPDVFVPLLEEGSKTSDEELSRMFSSLLAEHLDPSRSNAVHPSYAKVLAQFSPLDARAVLRFWNLASDPEYRKVGLRGGVMTSVWLAERMGIDGDAALLICLNLARLGLVEHDGTDVPDGHPLPELFEDMADHRFYRITEYGVRFCESCNRGRQPDPFDP